MTTRILLWSPLGAGEHYYGPGAFAHRLYSSATPGSLTVELAHASPAQSTSSLFAQSHRLEPQPDDAWRMARYLWRSKRWLRRNAARFDVFHGLNGFHPTVAPAFDAQQLGLPSVIFVAGHRIEFTDKSGLRALVGLARRRRRMAVQLSALIAMSRAIHQELLGFGVDPRRIARIPMGIDMRRFSPAIDTDMKRIHAARFGLLRDMPTVIFVGAITARKRPHLIVEALGLLRRQGLDVQLVLAGPAPQTEYCVQMKARAATLQIESRVHWVGHVTAIETALQAADVFVLPSASEGMPAALVEAMACGLPAIVTRISGCEDLVSDDSNGYFVAPDAAEIAERIRLYALDAALCARHGEHARQEIVSICSNETVLGAYLRVFDAVRHGRDPESASTLRF